MAHLGFALLGGSVVITLATGGAAQTLGADPLWAITAALIGAPVGALLAAILPARIWIAALAALTCVVAFAASNWGKAQFLASFDQNLFAERLWFHGWIATAALAATTLGLSFRNIKARALS